MGHFFCCQVATEEMLGVVLLADRFCPIMHVTQTVIQPLKMTADRRGFHHFNRREAMPARAQLPVNFYRRFYEFSIFKTGP